MPAHVTPRNLLGDVRFDMEQMLEDLKESGARLAHVNRTRHQIVETIDLVQTLLAQAGEGGWDGQTERRRSASIVAMMQQAAEAEVAASWDPRTVVA